MSCDSSTGPEDMGDRCTFACDGMTISIRLTDARAGQRFTPEQPAKRAAEPLIRFQ